MQASLTITTTAQQILPRTNAPATQFRQVILLNTTAETIYLGDSAVTAADGFPLVTNASLALASVSMYTRMFARTNASTSTLKVLEVQ